MLSERIKTLRQQSQQKQPSLSIERARLLTEYYASGAADQLPVPVARARAFQYILEHKKISINPGELIVGERGPHPQATPTYPEICVHSLQDFKILNDREKISFQISKEAAAIQGKQIIPFWQGRSLRDRIFREMDKEWIEAYQAGVFTEFLEQRAPGHTVLDNKIYHKGLQDFQADIIHSIAGVDFFNDPEALTKRSQLQAMHIAADALISYANRYAKEAAQKANREKNKVRREELKRISKICQRVPAQAPHNFWEALQYYWFVHLGVIIELNTWDSFNPGRLDQHLYPFYQREIADQSLTPDSARELLQAFWIKFNNQPAPPKVGVTAQESNTYTDFCLINLGGVDQEGHNAVNELSYLILDVIEEMRLLQPSSMVQISKKTPHAFLERAMQIIKTGFGQPSVFNTDEMIQEMLRQGKTLVDARQGGASGCVETGAFGKESYILTGYFNLVKILELTLNNGIDPRSGKQIGLASADAELFENYTQLFSAYEKQLRHFIDIKIKGNRIIERLWAQNLPAPFMSILINDCIEKGKDYNAGGARYNTAYIQGVGIGTITDSLTALKYFVYDQERIELEKFLTLLSSNFKKADDFPRQLLQDSPKYGNDQDYADDILKQIFKAFFSAVDGRPNTKGGHYHINLLPTTVHVYFGSVVGATPDGRLAGYPLSEGISPVQGADKQGPTAVLKSAAKLDHIKTGGTLLNQKFTPELLSSTSGLKKVVRLIRTYFRMEGHHIQFNVVDAETLRKAQRKPQAYRNLIVRVAGYSDYFVDLTRELQDEIISRTVHGKRV